jgi:hypothetical protein
MGRNTIPLERTDRLEPFLRIRYRTWRFSLRWVCGDVTIRWRRVSALERNGLKIEEWKRQFAEAESKRLGSVFAEMERKDKEEYARKIEQALAGEEGVN